MPRRSPAFSHTSYDDTPEDEDDEEAIRQLRNKQQVAVIPLPRMPTFELTPKLSEEIITLVESGMMIQDAATYLMIHPKTMRGWLAKGETDPSSEYGWFSFRVRQAQAIFTKEMVQNVRSNAKRDGNVALKVLEKAAKGDWAANSTSEVNVKGHVIHEHVGTELARIVEERKAKKLAAQAGVQPQEIPIEGEIREVIEEAE